MVLVMVSVVWIFSAVNVPAGTVISSTAKGFWTDVMTEKPSSSPQYPASGSALYIVFLAVEE